MIEPRTTSDIISDLLQLAIDGEWSGTGSSYDDYANCCPECGALLRPHVRFGAKEVPGEHKPDCQRMRLINEARAFLRVENNLAKERGEEGVRVP